MDDQPLVNDLLPVGNQPNVEDESPVDDLFPVEDQLFVTDQSPAEDQLSVSNMLPVDHQSPVDNLLAVDDQLPVHQTPVFSQSPLVNMLDLSVIDHPPVNDLFTMQLPVDDEPAVADQVSFSDTNITTPADVLDDYSDEETYDDDMYDRDYVPDVCGCNNCTEDIFLACHLRNAYLCCDHMNTTCSEHSKNMPYIES